MHNISPPLPPNQVRKRSNPSLSQINTTGPNESRRPSGQSSPQLLSANGLTYSNGTVGGHRHAATNAANAAFPNGRSPLPSPIGIPTPQPSNTPPVPPLDKEPKSKSSKMKLFSKPKNITLSKDKESKVGTGAQSPSKSTIGAHVLRNGFANASTTSLVDPGSSGSSLYASANASTSTLVPPSSEKEREKHRHNFLSRGKHKLNEHAVLPLSSASSNSQATNPEKPQPLYSFTPDSPGAGSFAKSMSGLDLRHGGRALREKKREEKAAAAAKLDLTPIVSNASAGDKNEFLGPGGYETPFGPPSGIQSTFSLQNDGTTSAVSAQTLGNVGASMGLPGIGPDDAWPLLKARLLNLFSGESLLRPVEELNVLVSVHIRRCIQRKTPSVVIEDLSELLQTGFSSLAQTLRGAPDDKLINKLVDMWISVYTVILPFLQAVFLPLDLEFKGRGTYMSTREAEEFWGAIPDSWRTDDRPSSAGGAGKMPTLGEELDVRRITLITFRDTVILPKHEPLMAIFSRLSLGNIGAAAPSPDPNKGREHARSDPAAPGAERPGTAGSLSPNMSSFNSQGSTLLDAASNSSGGAISFAGRSRATSSTSAGSFGTSLPHVNHFTASLTPTGGPPAVSLTTAPTQNAPVIQDPAKVTDTVGRMLQCLYVLASCQTGDVGQGAVEALTGALKYNWLGRGRTGGDRRGWVGMRNPGTNGRVGLVGA